MTPQTIPEGMRLIEHLRGKKGFEGSTFWIIGSDPNLDHYPDDFFKNKFSIVVNFSCVAFPEGTFLFINGEALLEWAVKKYPDWLKKILMPTGWWERWGAEPVYFKTDNKPMPATVPDYESAIKRILSGSSYEFVSVRTSAHCAIFVAIVLGAKKIVLVGCSHRTSKGRSYAQKRGIGDITWAGRFFRYGERYDNELPEDKLFYGVPGGIRIRRDTIQFAKIAKKYGIEIIRHRFDENRNEFLFEEIKEEEQNNMEREEK